jgi:hypothetical protein
MGEGCVVTVTTWGATVLTVRGRLLLVRLIWRTGALAI